MPGLPILLVEDDDDIVSSLTDLLTDEGYEVAHMPNARAALAILESGYRPAAMVVDFGIPEMNGLDFVRACSARPALSSIPAIVMSAFRPVDLAPVGMGAYLQKPFEAGALFDQLANLIGNSRG